MIWHRLGLALGAALLWGSAEARAFDLTTIAVDPFTQATCKAAAVTNHQAIVEPDSFAAGATIVAAFQSGRIQNSGACAIGFATSKNNGASWTSGILPGLTKFSGGSFDRVSDPAVAYDARHNVWLVASLAIRETAAGTRGAAVLVSRSADGGLTWTPPRTVDAASIDSDKEWIVCDNSVSSQYYGNCYVTWDDHGAANKLLMSTSRDGGLTWGPPKANGAKGIGGQPLVRRDGIVIVPVANTDITAIGAFHSSNGGASWSGVTRIAAIRHHEVTVGLREEPLPSAEIDGAGKVYVAWSDCRFRASCKANDIVFAKSRNAVGTSWSIVKRVPIDGTGSGIDHVVPGLAVNAADSQNVRMGLVYYFLKPGEAKLNIGFISSRDGGKTWSIAAPVTTLATAFPVSWAASTNFGRMVGDYISASFAGDQNAHAIVSFASAPTTGPATGCTTTKLDNCRQVAATFTAPVASAALIAASGPVLFTGAGDAAFARSRGSAAVRR